MECLGSESKNDNTYPGIDVSLITTSVKKTFPSLIGMKTSNALQDDKALSYNMAVLCQKLEGHYPP